MCQSSELGRMAGKQKWRRWGKDGISVVVEDLTWCEGYEMMWVTLGQMSIRAFSSKDFNFHHTRKIMTRTMTVSSPALLQRYCKNSVDRQPYIQEAV